MRSSRTRSHEVLGRVRGDSQLIGIEALHFGSEQPQEYPSYNKQSAIDFLSQGMSLYVWLDHRVSQGILTHSICVEFVNFSLASPAGKET